MSSQKPPPSDFTPEDPVEYVDGDVADDSNDEEYDDEDEEEEDEFVPGYDDDDEEDGAIVPLLDGILSLDQENMLHYRGDGFHLVSTKPIDSNLLSSATKPANNVYAFVMEGPCDIESVSGTPTHRTMDMTWSVQDSREAFLSPSQGKRAKQDDDEEEENKKAPARFYSVYGKQADGGKGESLELQGGFSPTAQGNDINLVCQVRIVSTHPQTAVAAATPVAAARVDNEVEDDDDEADDGVDYDELIALHEDAGLSVEELRRKYRTGESTESPSKRPKTQEKEQDDDDEDYCF
jgi:hypothetical protein